MEYDANTKSINKTKLSEGTTSKDSLSLSPLRLAAKSHNQSAIDIIKNLGIYTEEEASNGDIFTKLGQIEDLLNRLLERT
jgi:hypothetical protein